MLSGICRRSMGMYSDSSCRLWIKRIFRLNFSLWRAQRGQRFERTSAWSRHMLQLDLHNSWSGTHWISVTRWIIWGLMWFKWNMTLMVLLTWWKAWRQWWVLWCTRQGGPQRAPSDPSSTCQENHHHDSTGITFTWLISSTLFRASYNTCQIRRRKQTHDMSNIVPEADSLDGTRRMSDFLNNPLGMGRNLTSMSVSLSHVKKIIHLDASVNTNLSWIQ